AGLAGRPGQGDAHPAGHADDAADPGRPAALALADEAPDLSLVLRPARDRPGAGRGPGRSGAGPRDRAPEGHRASAALRGRPAELRGGVLALAAPPGDAEAAASGAAGEGRADPGGLGTLRGSGSRTPPATGDLRHLQPGPRLLIWASSHPAPDRDHAIPRVST